MTGLVIGLLAVLIDGMTGLQAGAAAELLSWQTVNLVTGRVRGLLAGFIGGVTGLLSCFPCKPSVWRQFEYF